MDTQAEATTWRFDNFLLDSRARVLFCLGADRAPIPIVLGSRASEILCLLVEQRGGLVSRQQIMDAVWPDIAVEENNLTVQISALRRALDVAREGGSSIQTVPGRGYRFVPAVLPRRSPGHPRPRRPPHRQRQAASPIRSRRSSAASRSGPPPFCHC
jgi:DNA-binding winged helix-turn-helix (wHTH) protein